MINVELRAQGIGGSDVAAIVGLDPRRDAFAVYADKLGLVERSEPNARMKWGKRLERVIVDAYSEETGRSTIWIDETRRNPAREWQVYTPDAMCTAMLRGIDAKNVSFDQAAKWGEIGSDLVPDSIALQCQWYCSSADIPVWDVAALFGGNDLRIYTVNRDPEIEAALLEEAENFWKNHGLARVPPPIGSSATAATTRRHCSPPRWRRAWAVPMPATFWRGHAPRPRRRGCMPTSAAATCAAPLPCAVRNGCAGAPRC